MRAYSAKNCDKENAQAVAFVFLNTACKIKPFVGPTVSQIGSIISTVLVHLSIISKIFLRISY